MKSLAKTKPQNGTSKVRDYILTHFKVGQKLPREGELSNFLGTTNYAAARALNELSSEGFVDRKPRKGTILVSNTRSSSTQQVRMIAFIADNFEYYVHVLAGIEEELRGKNLAVTLIKSDFNPKLELSHLESLQDNGYGGAIVRLAEHTQSVPILKKLADRNFPMVLIDNEHEELAVPCVRPDQEKTAYEATKYLIELGHQRIAHVTQHENVRRRVKSIARREAGYRRALKDAGIEIRPEYIVQSSFFISEEEKEDPRILAGMGYEPMHQLLCLPKPPTAVTFGFYWLSLAACRAIQNCGLRVPEDISLMGLEGDGSEIRFLPKPLTTMSDQPHSQGKIAATIIQKIIKTGQICPETILMDEKLLVRQTTAPPKK